MDRYVRNRKIAGFGDEGQHKLKMARVLVIGAGGLGSPVLYYLAAAGVGTLGIVDDDVVSITNLQRQILYLTSDLGKLKCEQAKERLLALNPEIAVEVYKERLVQENAVALLTPYDFIIDCSDNYGTKFLIADVCAELKKPYSHGAIYELQGEVMTCLPETAGYRSVFSAPPEEDDNTELAPAGVLGAVAGVIGSIQAAETVKFLTGMGELITNRILIFDGRTLSFHSLKVASE